jgi:hypothetical protein
MTLGEDESSSAPKGDADDSFQERRRPSVIARTPDGVRLQRLLEAMEDYGDDAEAFYEETLAEVKEHSTGVLFEIARALGDCHSDDYPLRWSLTYAAVTIGGEEALPLLANLAQTPIPEEFAPDPHSFSTVEEETIIRTTAVDGISDLARGGSEAAVDILFDLLGSPSFSIRRAAVVGLKNSPKGEDLVRRITDCLPEEERFLVDLKSVEVRQVEQVDDPRRHLSESGREAHKDSPPNFGDRPERAVDPGPTSQKQTRSADVVDEADEHEKGE